MRHAPRFPGRIPLSPRDRGPSGSRRSSHRRRPAVFRLERLEDRTVLSTVTTLADSGPGSLRQAILDANTNLGTDVIDFAPQLHGTITLGDELAITGDLTIEGRGPNKLTISGNDHSRVFDISPDITVTISGLTITGGRADNKAPVFPGFGGGILNRGNLTLTDDVVSHNQAVGDGIPTLTGPGGAPITGTGGGGGVATLGPLTVTDSTFIANRALGGDQSESVDPTFPGMGFGGGLYNANPTTKITDSRFIGNLAQGGSHDTGTFAGLGQGGGIFTNADLTVTHTSFISNRAVGGDNNNGDINSGNGAGGGISSGSVRAVLGLGGNAKLDVSQSAFSFNQAVGGKNNTVTTASLATGPSDGFGGGIWVYQGSATIRQSTLDYNLARGGAGGGDQEGSLGVGGGIFFFNIGVGVQGIVDHSALVGNAAIGGPGGSGVRGGDALGGGLVAGGLGGHVRAPATVTVSNTLVAANLALGGNGSPGGDGLGGGLHNDTGSTLNLNSSHVHSNLALGGFGFRSFLVIGSRRGHGRGGGVYTLGTFNPGASDISGNFASTSNDNIFVGP